MGLLDDIEAESSPSRQSCSVGELLASLPKDEADDLTRALADPRYKHTVITRVLNSKGYGQHDKRIATHRRGDCACYR
jgi:hypothetical protein